jgi:hypothetical protein
MIKNQIQMKGKASQNQNQLFQKNKNPKNLLNQKNLKLQKVQLKAKKVKKNQI